VPTEETLPFVPRGALQPLLRILAKDPTTKEYLRPEAFAKCAPKTFWAVMAAAAASQSAGSAGGGGGGYPKVALGCQVKCAEAVAALLPPEDGLFLLSAPRREVQLSEKARENALQAAEEAEEKDQKRRKRRGLPSREERRLLL